MGENEVMELFEDTGALLSGHFLLSSGLHSPRYIQCARLLQYPWYAERVGRALAEKVRPLGPFGAVVGPALGGVLVAYELGRALGVRALFVEREGPRFALRRGFALALGERVLVAEDVVTTGGSTLETAEVVAAQGGQVVAAACLVDRRAAHQPLPFPLFSLVQLAIPTYPPEECPLCRAGVPLEKPGSRPRS